MNILHTVNKEKQIYYVMHEFRLTPKLVVYYWAHWDAINNKELLRDIRPKDIWHWTILSSDFTSPVILRGIIERAAKEWNHARISGLLKGQETKEQKDFVQRIKKEEQS